MKIYMYCCFLSFSLWFGPGVYGQSPFNSGYIIGLSGDSTWTQIDANNPYACIYKSGNSVQEYQPNEIQGFGIPGQFFTSSLILKDTFVQVLIKGDLDLFKSQKGFILRKMDGLLVNLRTTTNKVVASSGGQYTTTDNKWIGLLKFLTIDCVTPFNENYTMTEQRLTRFVIDYHHCKKADYTEYSNKLPWLKVKPSLGVGLNYKMVGKLQVFSDVTAKIKGVFAAPFVGLVLSMPRSRNHSYLQIRLQLNTFKFNTINYYKTLIFNYKIQAQLKNFSILAPITFHQQLFLKRQELTFFAGLQFEVLNKFDLSYKVFANDASQQLIHNFAYNDLHSKLQYGFVGGLSTNVRIGKHSISPFISYNFGTYVKQINLVGNHQSVLFGLAAEL